MFLATSKARWAIKPYVIIAVQWDFLESAVHFKQRTVPFSSPLTASSKLPIHFAKSRSNRSAAQN